MTAAVQMQALAHPEVAIQFFLRDGKQVLSTPGKRRIAGGGLLASMAGTLPGW